MASASESGSFPAAVRRVTASPACGILNYEVLEKVVFGKSNKLCRQNDTTDLNFQIQEAMPDQGMSADRRFLHTTDSVT